MNVGQLRDFYEDYMKTIVVEHRIDQLDRFYAADIIANPPIQGVEPGLAGVRLASEAWMAGFSDVRYAIHDFIYDRDQEKLVTRLSMTVTHSGSFAGVPATGRRVQFDGHAIYRLKNGKIAEYWDSPYLLSLVRLKLGVMDPAFQQALSGNQEAP